MRIILNIVGVLMTLMGAVWFLQGINILPGSFMTGQIRWAVYGGGTAMRTGNRSPTCTPKYVFADAVITCGVPAVTDAAVTVRVCGSLNERRSGTSVINLPSAYIVHRSWTM